MRLETERLILRMLDDRDADDLYPILSDYEVTRNLLIPYPFPRERMPEWIRDRREAMNARERYVIAIELKETGRVMGVCEFVGVSWKDMHGELIYWIGKDYWGKGYMPEAARRFVQFGFEELGFERIAVGCFTRNEASKRVIEKLGFTYEGRTRHEYLKDGEYQDAYHFGMLREEYFRNE